MTNILNVISAMAEAAAQVNQGTLLRPQHPVITISRDYGSGGDIIATRLSQRLDVPLYDHELLQAVAARMQEDPAIIRQIDEGIGRVKDLWLYRLLSGKDVSYDTYRDTLIKLILTIGRMGGVVVGRGAHIVLASSCALRVRIAGTPEICARRMTAGGHGEEVAELDKALRTNHSRGKFVWEMFASRLSDASQFDVVVNTDRMEDFEDAVDMLVGMANAIHSGRVLSRATLRAAE
jgi:cytidylate kinase